MSSDDVANKANFEVLSQRDAIVRKLNNISMVHCFKANFTTNLTEKEPLGQMMVSTTKRAYSLQNRNEDVVELHLAEIYENEIAKENDLKELRNRKYKDPAMHCRSTYMY